MDFVSHSVMGIVIAHATGRSIEEMALCAVVGSAPDTLSWLERKITGKNDWTFYNTLHSYETCSFIGIASLVWFLVFQSLLPFLLLASWCVHIVIDDFTHGEGKEWWKGRLWVEITGWILILLYWSVVFL